MTKTSDSEVLLLEICRMRSTPPLPLLLGTVEHEGVAPDRIQYIGQIEQSMCYQMTNIKFWLCAKKSSGSFKNVIY